MRGDGQIIRLQGAVTLPFPREKKERAVLDDRPTYIGSVIVIVIGECGCGEEVLRIQPVVVSEIEGRAVEIVGAALERHVDCSTPLDPVLCRRKLLNGVLGDGIVAEHGSRDPQYAGLPDNLAAVEAVVIGHAIDHVIVGGGALAAHANVQKTATRRALHAGGKGQDGLKITALRR